jgi:uncharacterized membrane protein YhhN
MNELMQPAITILTFLSAAVAILSHYLGWRSIIFYISKPLTTTLIFLAVLAAVPNSEGAYVPLIAAGLAFGLFGDIFLMLPEERFVFGIASFAATHVLYLAAFITAAGLALVNPSAIPLVLFAILMTRFLWPGLRDSLRVPVLVYVVLISFMTVQAIGAAIELETTGMALAAAGAVFFLASDSMLAVDRFRIPFTAARGLVLSTYWLGQWLIASSAITGI